MIELSTDIEAVEGDWVALADRAEPSPLMHPGWFLAWWRAYGEGSLQVATLRRAGELVAVLPLLRTRTVLRSPTNWDSDVYGVVAADENARRELVAGLFGLGPAVLDFSFLETSRPEPGDLAEAAGRYRLERRTILESPYVDHTAFGGWDAYWDDLAGKLRSNVRRARRKLEERGEVEFELIADPGPRLHELLEIGFAIEASGWKGEGGSAIESSTASRRFYEEGSAWAARRGILRIGFLRVAGRPVGFHLGIETPEAQYLMKLGIAGDLAKIGLGHIVLGEMVRHGFAAGLARTEFMGAADFYKSRWATDKRELIRLQAFAPGPVGSVHRVAQTHGRKLAKRALRLRRGGRSG